MNEHETCRPVWVYLMFFCILLLSSRAEWTNAADNPVLQWPIPGITGPDGKPYYPMWSGNEYMDSARSTGATRLHAIGITGAGVSAAVIDTPYQTLHPIIANNVIAEASAGFSLYNPEGEPSSNPPSIFPYSDNMFYTGQTKTLEGKEYEVYMGFGLDAVSLSNDTSFRDVLHGTHVAGTIVGMAPGAGLVLVNPSSYISEFRTRGFLFELLETELALEYVADVSQSYNIVAVNNSWGNAIYRTEAEADQIHDETHDAIIRLAALGVIPVFASGNESTNDKIAIPAAFPEALAVGAMNRFGLITPFSNQSEKVVLLAPGHAITSAVPFDDQEALNGTSMAAPHVTGGIALLSSGARNASTGEILSAMIDSADRVKYDGSLVLPPEAVMIDAPGSVRAYIESRTGKDYSVANTMDDWREYQRLINVYGAVKKHASEVGFDDIFNAENEKTDFGQLQDVDYRFLRVDKAYMLLTERRGNLMADKVSMYNSSDASVLQAFSRELGSGLHQDSADAFQRLDSLSVSSLAVVARQMSPAFTQTIVESSQMGITGLHRSIQKRFGAKRIEQNILGSPVELSDVEALGCVAPTTSPTGFEIWAEGFAAFSRFNGATNSRGYNSHFNGTALGLERRQGDAAFGVFGSWADSRVKSDEDRADGDWFTAGLYGRIDKPKWFTEVSLAYNYGQHDSKRGLYIPGAMFSSNIPGQYITLPAMNRSITSRQRAHGASGRLAGGADLWEIGNWRFGPRAEASFSFIRASDYKENGAGAFGLNVDSYRSAYFEGGLGLGVARGFIEKNGSNTLLFSTQVTGLYGAGTGNDITGSFSRYGSRFRISPERVSTAWGAPEVALAWKINQRTELSASYSARLGKRRTTNNFSIGLSAAW